MKNSFFLALTMLIINACGSETKYDTYAVDVKLCDPTDNASACPQTLRNDAAYKRDIQIGDEGIGIQVTDPSEENILAECRSLKLSMLENYVEEKDLDKNKNRMIKGEFIDKTSYKIVAEGKNCVRKNVLGSCTKSEKFARIVCSYSVFSSPSLIPVK